MTTPENWDLNSIFTGGSASSALTDFIAELSRDLTRLTASPLPGQLTAANQVDWIARIQTMYDLTARLGQVESFIECLLAQNVEDAAARMLQSDASQRYARLETLWTRLNASLALQPDKDWQRLLETPELAPVAFNLAENRKLALDKLGPDTEALINELSADGYHAWDQLYNTVAGLKKAAFAADDATDSENLSLGQLQNIFTDNPDRETRRRAFAAYHTAWQDLAPVCALALNNQAGFRLTTYRHRDWDSIMKEPLFKNRLSRQTIDTMWQVIAAKSGKLLDFFAAKAKLMGADRLHWYDVNAPVGSMERAFTFAEAGDFVVDNLGRLNPDIAEFCRMAIDNRWVEAENRPGKAAGAFCTSFPLIRESRIFMTFGGSYNSLSTLAHELGHGYHSWVMRDLPFGARHYTMSVAETASTFNELAVNEACLGTLTDKGEKISLLNQKLSDAASFFMNLRARYDFEQAFFEQRATGPVSVETLSALMLEAQKTAFHNGLAEAGYHDLFWASKLHFYITHMPFYNFPYTFGFLFSHGIYRMARQEGNAFGQRYRNLLRDTGSMDTETLARVHLGVDLAQPEFWQQAVDGVLSEVDEFVELVG